MQVRYVLFFTAEVHSTYVECRQSDRGSMHRTYVRRCADTIHGTGTQGANDARQQVLRTVLRTYCPVNSEEAKIEKN